MKNYFYYDTNNLFVRNMIADFEYDILNGNVSELAEDNCLGVLKNRFQPIVAALNELLNTKGHVNTLKQWLSRISYRLVPKEVKNCDNDSNGSIPHFITNRISESPVIVTKYNIIADVPVELHIITFLWAEYVGVKLSNGISNDNYAYQLNFTEDDNSHERIVSPGLSIVKPYFMGYKQWRNKALIEAKRLIDNGNDVTMLSLDIRRYFYSLRVNVHDIYSRYLDKNIYNNVSEEKQQKIYVLNDALQQIHLAYHEKVKNLLPNYDAKTEKQGYTVLPVGLLSSGILGNLYLSDFDTCIRNKVCPHYYGRYVDDMLFVFSNHFVGNENEVDGFIDDYFCSKQVLFKEKVNNDIFYTVSEKNGNADKGRLVIQSDKVVMQHFEHSGSHAAIDLFMNDVNINRSEYRFLPDEDYITREFDSEAYNLLYQDNSHKFRSILDCRQDRYGVAKFLSNQIFLSKLSGISSDCAKSVTARQTLTFFQHNTAIDMFSLWERVATYFVVNRDYKSLWKYCDNIKHTIDHLEYETHDEDVEDGLRKALFENLRISVAMAFALCPKELPDRDKEDIMLNCHKLRLSNMFRIDNVGIMGVNMTKYLFDESVNLYLDDLLLDGGETICILRLLYPTYIHLEELNMLELYKYIAKYGINEKCDCCYCELEKNYQGYNKEWQCLFSGECSDSYEDEIILMDEKGEYVNIHDDAGKPLSYSPDKKVAIVNTKVANENFMSIVKYHKSRCSMQRRNELCKVINDAAKENSDILVMPELTVPFEWLKMLAGQAKRTGMAIVTGLEYYIDNQRVIYNFVATILPILDHGIMTCLMHLRLKNFYSPKERLVLEGYHFNLPKQPSAENVRYNLFHWRKCYFSVYNCFELADINSRMRYQSKVDFIIAVEYNRDTHYYSDLVGAWARDVHCFIIQVNTSDYGDSKVIMPSKTDNKTLVHVKGGDNSAVLVTTLPIRRLRDFQLGGYIVQKDDKQFKFTPPSFSHEEAHKRFEDVDFGVNVSDKKM